LDHKEKSREKQLESNFNQNARASKLLADPVRAVTNQLRILEATARTLAESLGTLAALEESRAIGDTGSGWLDLKAIADGYGIKRDAVLNAGDRGELTIKRGPRQKLLVKRSEMERWLGSKPYLPRAPKISAPTSPSNDWERRASAELARVGGPS
jgi:hypothetical protein